MGLNRRRTRLEYRCANSSSPPFRKSAKVERIDQPSIHKSTGPRTHQGKQRSKYNALKHGIYSKAPLLKDESRARFQSLLQELLEYHRPEGSTEELLMEKLAILIWRHRRFLKPEIAEIAKGTEFLGADDLRRLEFDAQDRENALEGMLHNCTNPIVLDNAIELLNQLRGNFEEGGLGIEKDLCILRKLYGPFSTENPPRGLPHAYLTFGTVASHSPGEGGDAFPLTATEAREEAIKSVGREISRLRRLKKHVESVESSRRAYTAQSLLVPKDEVPGRLLRYDAHLSREFDRTLNQLECLQRMRKGQPVLPPIKVEVSS
jgi:hypothetical protein